MEVVVLGLGPGEGGSAPGSSPWMVALQAQPKKGQPRTSRWPCPTWERVTLELPSEEGNDLETQPHLQPREQLCPSPLWVLGGDRAPIPCKKISSSALHMLEWQHLMPYCSVTGVRQFSRMFWEKQPLCWVMVPSSFLLLTKHTLPVQVGRLQWGTSQAHSSSSAGTRRGHVPWGHPAARHGARWWL